MTPKQKFLRAFLMIVYGFSEVGFEPSCSSCASAFGIYRFKVTVPSWCILVESMTREEKVHIDVWVDKLKDGFYSIKFKTWHNHIPQHQFEEVKNRTRSIDPNAKVDIYYRTGSSWHSETPTLRLVVPKLPWK